MSETIESLVNDLPISNVTVYALHGLDIIMPGEWDNLVGFENTINVVTGETDPDFIRQIADRANELYNDPNEGYQRAMWLYRTIDKTDMALGTAALANKVGSKIPLLGSFITSYTPKADTAQMIDLSLKVVVELVAFCYINGIPGDSLSDFLAALGEYTGESKMRLVALACIDGLIPLGPDFTQLTMSTLSSLSPSDWLENSTFAKIQDDIPGDNIDSKLSYVNETFVGIKDWMDSFISSNEVTTQKIVNNMQSYIEVADDKLDYLGAFLDITTNYYTHTGTQTLARRLIERAVNEV
ncbi:hypothetical protein QUF63_10775 [Anaerolineales bacterium HSG25]|nr:hypothetical protein [Anaerolineales bacterium HSG25]